MVTLFCHGDLPFLMFDPSGDFPGAVFRHLSVVLEEYCKATFAISWGGKK